MKSPTRCLPGRLVSAMAALLVFSTSSHGQALHWDTNGTAAGFGNFSGAWNGTAANWNTDATGAAGGMLTATTTSSNALVISGAGATGVIDLSTSQSAASLDFTNTANLAAFQLSNGASLTLTGAITDTGAGNADIRIINTSEASAAAKLTATSVTMGVVSVTAATGGVAQFLTTGYDITLQTQYSIGSVGGNTTVRQTAGTVTVHNAADRGFVFAPSSDHFLNSSLYTTRYILDGGTMRANRIGSGGFDGNNNTTNRWATSGRLEFNNGTIASLPNGTLVLQNGAAFGSYTGSGTKDMQHDTSKPFSIELAQSGTHTIHADGASGRVIVTPSAQLVDKTGEAGTVNKTGAGNLVFTGGGPVAANSYTGDTTVMQGAVATDYSLIAGQAATGGADPLANGYSAASTLVLAGGNYSLVGRSSAGATSATGVTLTPGTTLVNVGSTTGWVVGQAVSNANFPPGTYIRRIVSATTIELNAMSTSLSVQTNQTLNLGAATFANTQTIHGVVLQQTGTITVTPGAGSSTTQLGFGQVSGPGGIHKAGTGTLHLTGNSTYTGDTVVSAGTLAIFGDCSSATGTISVAPGATLSLGPVAILGGPVISNGRVLPGTYHTPLTLSATSRVPITVRSATDYDTLTGDGTDVLAFENNTTLELNFTGYTPTAGDTFTLFPQWASRTGNASAVMVTTTGLDPQYALDTTNLLVNGSASLRRVAASPIVRQPDGTLLKLATGERFFPVGFNYIRLGPGGVAHATFHVTDYDGPAASTMFQRVAQAGYTTVRVFISSDASSQNGAGWQTSADTPLNATYLDHFADFLKRAAAEGILVQPSMPSFPWNTKYASIVGPTLPMITGANSTYFHLGHMAAREAYLIDFWNGIRGRYPDCAEALLCVDLENELNYDLTSQPISLASGTFLAANGQSYDLATQKQNLADDMAVYWINRMGATIRSVLPTTLINANVFTPYAVGRTGPDDFRLFNVGWKDRMPFRPRALAASNADIVDIHFYWRTLEESPADFASIEFNTFKSEALAAGKVLVVGEFGSLY
ncbi:MAG: beta strand repeat-containing protein, partial [Luteolibacter sp.]